MYVWAHPSFHPLLKQAPSAQPVLGSARATGCCPGVGCLLFWLSLGTSPVTPQQCSVSSSSQRQIPGLGVAGGGPRPLSLFSPSFKLVSGEQEVVTVFISRPWAPAHITPHCRDLGLFQLLPTLRPPLLGHTHSLASFLRSSTTLTDSCPFPTELQGLWASLDIKEQ